MVYIGSDVPLSTIEWNEESPDFFLTETEVNINDVKQFFSKRRVYYAGSQEYCGCGFFYDEQQAREDMEEKKKAVRKLIETLLSALESQETVELFVRWASDNGVQKPLRRIEMNSEQLLAEEFPLEEGDFVIFRK